MVTLRPVVRISDGKQKTPSKGPGTVASSAGSTCADDAFCCGKGAASLQVAAQGLTSPHCSIELCSVPSFNASSLDWG